MWMSSEFLLNERQIDSENFFPMCITNRNRIQSSEIIIKQSNRLNRPLNSWKSHEIFKLLLHQWPASNGWRTEYKGQADEEHEEHEYQNVFIYQMFESQLIYEIYYTKSMLTLIRHTLYRHTLYTKAKNNCTMDFDPRFQCWIHMCITINRYLQSKPLPKNRENTHVDG